MVTPPDGPLAGRPRRPSLADRAAEPSTPPGMGARRAEVLAWLRRAGEPCTAATVAGQAGLHLNTARFHLDALVESGHAERRAEGRATRGRPRILYSALVDHSQVRSYRLLAGMLTSLVRTLQGDEEAALEAGRAWGRHLVEGVSPLERLDADGALDRLDGLMEQVGFAPQTQPGGRPEIHLRHCPFVEVVEGNQDVVCAMHRGLMQGALDELGAPVRVATLEPFALPGTCVARLERG